MLLNKRGFSLIELLIYVAILSIVLLLIVGTFAVMGKSRAVSEAKAEVNANLRFALEKISQDVRATTSITEPAVAGATSTQLILVSATDIITYFVQDNRLLRQLNTESPESVLSDQVEVDASSTLPMLFSRRENINVIAQKNISIQINLSLRYKSSSPDWQNSATKQVVVSMR